MAKREDAMPTFICSFNFTDAGIRKIKNTPERRAKARMRAKKLGITVKDIYLTSGDSDLLYILDAPDGESVAKFALVVGAQGNVRTKTVRAYTEAEFDKLLGEISDMLPD
jgi:uncharacterized protein with GYD domain